MGPSGGGKSHAHRDLAGTPWRGDRRAGGSKVNLTFSRPKHLRQGRGETPVGDPSQNNFAHVVFVEKTQYLDRPWRNPQVLESVEEVVRDHRGKSGFEIKKIETSK